MWNARILVYAFLLVAGVQANAAEQIVVTLSNGDQLHGTLSHESADELTIQHPVLGEVKIPRAGTGLLILSDSSNPVAEDQAPVAKPAEQAAAQTADPASSPGDAVEASPAPSPWEGSVSLAASASDTTRRTYNIRLGGSLKRTLPLEKFDLTASWYWNQSDGTTTDNDVLVRANQEWDLERSQWFYFAQGTWQYDQFESWGHRISPYGGIGYNLFDDDDLTLAIKGGGGATYLYNTSELEGQLLFETTTSWKINEMQTLTGLVSIAPDVTDWSNFLLTIQADWKIKLDADSSWSVALGVRNIHYSQPTGGSSANDFKAYAGIDYGF